MDLLVSAKLLVMVALIHSAMVSNSARLGSVFLCGNKSFNWSTIPDLCVSRLQKHHNCRKLQTCINNWKSRPSEFPHIIRSDSPSIYREGDDVEFECTVYNIEPPYNILWNLIREGHTDLLCFNNQSMKGDKIHAEVIDNKSKLIVYNVDSDTDDGLYVCLLNKESQTLGQQNFTLEILYKPDGINIVVGGVYSSNLVYPTDTSSNVLVFNETTLAYIRCDAMGNPLPTITWTRQSDNMPDGLIIDEDDGNSLKINNLSRHDTGRYVCEARNEYGTISQYVDIKIQYPPVVRVSNSHKTAGRDAIIDLECTVYSYPPSTVTWIKDGIIVDTSRNQNRVFASNDHNTSILHVLKLNPAADYGNFTCEVSNILGEAHGHINLNGLPSTPIILSNYYSTRRHFYTLKWSYKYTQYERVTRFTYCYLRNMVWQNVNNINLVENVNALCFNETVPPKSTQREFESVLGDLSPNADYTLEIFVVNQYGRGDIVEHHFKTLEEDIANTPSTCTFHVMGQESLYKNTAVQSAFCIHLMTVVLAIVIFCQHG